MNTALTLPAPRGLALMFGWRRLLLVLVISTLWGLLINPAYTTTPARVIVGREILVGFVAYAAFGIFEQWPARMPRWIARWALQILAVAVSIPLTVLAIYVLTTPEGQPPFFKNALRLNGFMVMTMSSLLVAPWIAVATLFKQKEFAARSQALAFELERSELERKALDSRLRLLQAQVEPHFLFNTLANVRELVDSGSAQASKVLDHLITYLRAAVPRLHDPATTMGQELQLVRSYLELMHMRMPDRLQFEVQADEAATDVLCPPTTLLTLVENAVRHGIDPSEEGGKITVCVQVKDGRCCAQVRDTGVGLRATTDGLGTGLSSLRERLQIAFGGDAKLEIVALSPHGVRAEVDFPAERGAK